MAGVNSTCDPSGWQADALDYQTFCLEPGFINGDTYWLEGSYSFEDFNLATSQSSDVNGSRGQLESDATRGKEAANPLPTAPMDSRSSTNGHQLYGLAAYRDLIGNQFNAMCFPAPLEGLQPPQLMTARAVHGDAPLNPALLPGGTFSHAPFIPSQPLHRSPSFRQSSSPETNLTYSESEDDTEMRDFDFYGLPDIPSVPEQLQTLNGATMSSKESGVDDLTPLEMPDGSTRMTANWLPVDPDGGFMVAEPKGEYAAYEALSRDDHIFDMMLLSHARTPSFQWNLPCRRSEHEVEYAHGICTGDRRTMHPIDDEG